VTWRWRKHEGGFYEDLCFHAQQAAEKALKSVYLHFAWAFRYVHDLEELMTGLRRHGLLVPRPCDDPADAGARV
jgi:HEPN domain-containing protein